MKYYVWVILFFIAAYLLPLGLRPMLSPGEFSFAQIPYDMIANCNYLPDSLLYDTTTEKSFMTYWLSCLSMKLFGANAFGIRFAATLAIGLTSLLIAIFIRQLLNDKRLAALASVIYLSGILVYWAGIYPLSNSVFTFFAFLSTSTIALAIVEDSWTRRRVFMLILSGIALFGGFFTVGFLAVGFWSVILILFLLYKKRWLNLFTLFWIPLMVATVLSWIVGAVKFGLKYQFFNFLLQIVDTSRISFANWNINLLWYYLGVFVIAIMPGSILVFLSFRNSLSSQKELLKLDIYKFSLISTFIPFVIYPLLSEKSVINILPSIPYFAIIVAGQVALYLRSGIHIKFFNFILKFWGFIIGIIGFIAIICSPLINNTELLKCFPNLKYCLFVIAISGMMAVFSGVALLLNVQIDNWRRQLMVFFGGIAFILLAITALFPAGIDYRIMPEDMIKKLLTKVNYKLSDNPNITIVTFPKIVKAVSWICKRDDVYALESINADKNDNNERLMLKKQNLLLSLTQLENKILQLKANERLFLIYWSNKDNYPVMAKVKYSYIYTDGFFSLVIFDNNSKRKNSKNEE